MRIVSNIALDPNERRRVVEGVDALRDAAEKPLDEDAVRKLVAEMVAVAVAEALPRIIEEVSKNANAAKVATNFGPSILGFGKKKDESE